MGGKASRDKGSRAERLLVQHLVSLGFTARRIPLSGAMQGFKGDVIAERSGRSYLFEVKCRKDEFMPLYVEFEKQGYITKELADGDLVFRVTSDVDQLIDAFTIHFMSVDKTAAPKVWKRIKNYKKWLGEARYLAIKCDRKPFLFIEFL